VDLEGPHRPGNQPVKAAPQRGHLGFLARIGPASIAAFAVLGATAARTLREPLADPDVWWHLRTGQLIVATHHIPHTDPFSFTAFGKPWLVQEWGSQVVFHGIASTFGLRAIVVWRALMLVLFYVLVARLIVKEAGHRVGAWALVAIVAFAGASSWTERPNLFSFVLFAVTLNLLRRRDRTVWWFVPIAAVWANLHGMVLIGLGLVMVVAATEGLKIALRWEGAEPAWARRIGLVAGTGFLASFANPYGPGLHLYALKLVRSSIPLISEWGSPDFHTVDGALFLLLLLLAVVGLSLSPRRPDPTDVIVTLAFVTLAAMAARNLTLSSVVLGVTVARYLPGVLGRVTVRWQGRTSREVGSAAAAVLNVTCLAVVVAAFAILTAGDFPRSDSVAAVASPVFPVETLERLQGGSVRLYTDETWAGLALYLGWPHTLVALDGRLDFYGSSLVADYMRAWVGRPEWQDYMRRYCVTHVLLDDIDPLVVALRSDPGWVLIDQQTVATRGTSGAKHRAVMYAPRVLPPSCTD